MTFPSNNQSEHAILSLRCAITRPIFVLGVIAARLACFAGVVLAGDPADSACAHEEFIRRSLVDLASEITANVDSAYAHNFTVSPAHPDSTNSWLEAALASMSPDRTRDALVLTYHVSRWDFSLARKTRRRFLGRLWVLRELTVNAGVEYPPGVTRNGNQYARFDRTYRDWVRASDLAALNTGEFSSLGVPPATDFVSRWAAPVLAATGLGFLTWVFFSVR